MNRLRVRSMVASASLTAALVAGAPVAATASAQPNASSPAPGSVAAQLADSVPDIPGLPTGVPPAATAAPVALPEPSSTSWPFPSDFSQTSGTGLVQGGAALWTDFVYDDHGAEDNEANQGGSSGLAPTHGSYTYPTGTGYDGNNADIFTAGVGFDGSATYWRVDWNSMPDPSIPIAEWTMTPSDDTSSLTPTWPANAGLTTSAGIEYALVVDSSGAELVDAATGTTVATFPTSVDTSARSFIVRIPSSVLPVTGDWSVQLASGVSSGASTPTFATVSAAEGGLPAGGANVYNVGFRSYQQEAELVCPDSPMDPGLVAQMQAALDDYATTDGVPAVECGNMWQENDQANVLSGISPNVGKYALDVDWSQLQAKATVPAPNVYGYSDRWYVTPLDLSALGAGTIAAAGAGYTGPTYLSRIQPYSVYVPTGYDFSSPKPTPLTWILHSLGVNYNQYGSTAPSELAEVCQNRNSICATTEGFSDGEWYYAEAEVDFWDVWHQLALAYDLNPDATTMSGYSMGGWASYKLPEEYPDLFAESEPLEGPPICGVRVYSSAEGYSGGTQCSTDGDSTPLLGNIQWIPYVMTCGGIDELVPVTGCNEQAQAIQALGYRVDEFLYPTEDHLVFSVQNDFGPPDTALANPPAYRELDPGTFNFTWYPDLDSGPTGIDKSGPEGDIGPTSDYWVSGLTARNTAAGQTANVTADDAAIPDPAVTATSSTTPGPSASPTPYVENSTSWTLGATPAAAQTLSLNLTNVAAASVDATAAGLTCAAVAATTDGATALSFTHLKPGSAVTPAGSTAALTHANGSGQATVALASGKTTVDVCSSAAGAAVPPSVPESPLAAGLALAGLGTAGVLVYRRRRRVGVAGV